jgi:hypothetical protein
MCNNLNFLALKDLVYTNYPFLLSTHSQLLLQAFVWDLGFKDMPVDKIVDTTCVEISEALFSHPKGFLSPR